MKTPAFLAALARPFTQGRDQGFQAATALPPPPAPKVKPKQQSLPSYLRSAKTSTSTPLPKEDRRLINKDITEYRTGATTSETIRNFVKASPDLSAAVTSYVRLGITSGYTAVARNLDGTLNPEATGALQEVLTRMNVLNDYSIGYDDSQSIRSLSETWARELMMNGAMAGELVLSKARLPDKIQAINVNQIRLFPSTDGKRLIPQQLLGGEEIDLDIPTFFMVSLDQDTTSPYPDSPIEPALQAVLFASDFMNDIRRIVKKAIHPRVVITLNEEKFRKNLSPEARNDPDLAVAELNAVTRALEDQIANLEPGQAMVVLDTIGIDVVDHGNTNLSDEYKVIQGMADAKMATGAKVLPTVLGHSNGTSNTASAEVLMFMKYVEGTVWGKLNEMLSKVLTLAVRLLGHDVTVDFRYNAIDLRPDSELESFRSMKQSRVLDLLSLGLITDEQACIELTGQMPPAGYVKLSGTMFRAGAGTLSTQPTGDGYNGASNSGSTLNQNLNSSAPAGVKGGQGKQQSPKNQPTQAA